MNYRIYNNYKDYLPIFFTSTTLFGGLIGLSSMYESHTAIDYFTTTIAYAGLGMITGITYPISFPLLGVYVLYKDNNTKYLKFKI
jgi:hypothetical protein